MGDHDDKGQQSRSPMEGVRIIGAEEAQAALEAGQVAGRRPEDAPRYGDRPRAPEGPRPPLRFPMGDEGDPAEVRRPPVASAAAGGPPNDDPSERTAPHDLPHWSEPPSGDNPRVLPEDAEGDDDLGAWSSFASSGPRWRDQPADWEEADFDDAGLLADDETRVGALDPETGPSDLFTFDEPEPEPMRIRTRGTTDTAPAAGVTDTRRDVTTAVATGVGVAAVFLIALAAGEAVTAVLVGAVLVLAAVELLGALRQRGYQPATLLALVGTGCAVAAAYWRGEAALPLVAGLFVVFSLLWYLFGVVRASPALNAGATVLAFFYIGFLGSFAALLLKFPDGTGLLLGGVLATVAVDVGAFVVGSRMGHSLMAPEISPNKTWEGYVGGATLAVLVSIVVVRAIAPWDGGSAALLGAVVGFVMAPLGDLCESMLKRDLDVKDMGSFLPGHGGVLDRIDALLFTIPATYYLAKALELS
jgi:phosphatidate cytidylyltransferase